jgi:hypothetical protein
VKKEPVFLRINTDGSDNKIELRYEEKGDVSLVVGKATKEAWLWLMVGDRQVDIIATVKNNELRVVVGSETAFSEEGAPTISYKFHKAGLTAIASVGNLTPDHEQREGESSRQEVEVTLNKESLEN